MLFLAIESLMVDSVASELVTSSSLTRASDSLSSSEDWIGERSARPKSRSLNKLIRGESKY